jgi:hypothetical protein
MPIISEFYGIKIYMYWNEHMPPHFHAEYNEFTIVVDFINGVVIKGLFPGKQLKLVLAWGEIHKDELMLNWENSKKNTNINRIEPLK